MRVCSEQDCLKRAYYNYFNKTKKNYCKTHKKINMINVVSARCIEDNCDKFKNMYKHCLQLLNTNK